MSGRQAAIIVGSEKACPMLQTEAGVGGCLKEACAWWSQRCSACVVLVGINVACNVVEYVVALGAGADEREQKGT